VWWGWILGLGPLSLLCLLNSSPWCQINMEHWENEEWHRKQTAEQNLPHCHFVEQKPLTDNWQRVTKSFEFHTFFNSCTYFIQDECFRVGDMSGKEESRMLIKPGVCEHATPHFIYATLWQGRLHVLNVMQGRLHFFLQHFVFLLLSNQVIWK